MEIKSYILPVWMFILLTVEILSPFYQFNQSKLRHGAVNIAAGGISFVLIGLVFSDVIGEALNMKVGLAGFIGVNWLKFLIVMLLFDLWMYVWHRINHEVPFFWKFHKAHHADTAMDVTTGIRFHPIELLLSTIIRIPVYLLLGVDFEIIALYELLLTVVVLFHHSNIQLPEFIEKVLSWVIPTPAMHKVHHSDFYKETNSNYGSVLSIWDRLFGTFNGRYDSEHINIGLANFRDEKSQTLSGFMLIPFRKG